MASSTQAGIVRFAAADLAANDPLHTDLVRDGIADTLLHLDDEDAQCRVSWVTESTAKFRTTGTPAVADTWYPICPFGPFPVALRGDGTPFALVVRIAGSSDAQTFAVKFRAVLSTLRDAPSGALIGGAHTLTTATTVTNMTAAWLAPASTNLVAFSAEQALSAMSRYATLTALAGISASVEIPAVYLHIYGSTANTASTPQLCGVYAREYVGL